MTRCRLGWDGEGPHPERSSSFVGPLLRAIITLPFVISTEA
jgi:hypothetical protein